MIFLPGLSGQFIAIADTEDEAQQLRPLADNCLQVWQLSTSTTETALKAVGVEHFCSAVQC
jgi:hypothetical protein